MKLAAVLLLPIAHHVVRVGPDWLRIPLWCLVFPWIVVKHVVWYPSRFVLCASYWKLQACMFWAVWDGEFVPR